MAESLNRNDRKPVWLALSQFYLDTELQEYDFESIAKIFVESPFSLAKIKQIDKYEVFPLLYPNLLSPAGVWDGFDKEWLVMSLTKRSIAQTSLKKLRIDFSHRLLKWMLAEYWKQVTKVCDKLNT